MKIEQMLSEDLELWRSGALLFAAPYGIALSLILWFNSFFATLVTVGLGVVGFVISSAITLGLVYAFYRYVLHRERVRRGLSSPNMRREFLGYVTLAAWIAMILEASVLAQAFVFVAPSIGVVVLMFITPSFVK